jgi:hypothetical protein
MGMRLAAILFGLALLACGPAAAKTKPPAHFFKRVNVGGYKLAIECWGTGKPTVVLESGFSSSRFVWLGSVHATKTRICAYDRAGIGDSQERPGHTGTTAKIADELHTLLIRAKIPGPYVLGGWSMGGFDVRYYTLRYPAEVSGLVLVDATTPDFLTDVFGGRLTSPFEDMVAGDAATELKAHPDLGSRPLVVLTHGIPLTPADVPQLPDPEATWISGQKEVTRASTDSILVRADGDSHDIPEENPRLVSAAITLVVTAVRGQTTMPPCTATRMPRLGGTCLSATG